MMKQVNWIIVFLCGCLAVGCVTHTQHSAQQTYYSNYYYVLQPYWGNDSIILFPTAEVIDSSIFVVLDTIIDINSQSNHHRNGEKTWFDIAEKRTGDTIFITIYSEQYDGVMLNGLSSQVCYGVFYYKGFLFIRRKMESENSIFFQKTQSVINVQHYYSNAKIYKCTCKGERYPDPEMCIVKSVFVGEKLSQMHCQTYCPDKSWSILFDAE